MRAELELFRERGGSLWRMYLQGSRNTVRLSHDNRTFGVANLTTMEMGSLFLYESLASYHPKQLRIEPRTRIGLGLSETESSFALFALTGNYHQSLPRSFETDITARLQFATNSTPPCEQPSFGGADMVRGFREDDAIGRNLWSLQSELWSLLPGTARGDDGLKRFLRRQVRLAAFVDVGGIYQTTASSSGLRAGPGLGLRIVHYPFVIRLDWAYGIGDAATTGRGRGRFYFSVTTHLPF